MPVIPPHNFASVIFDFSGTLSSDVYFRALGTTFLARVQELVFGPDRTVAHRWMAGEWSTRDVAAWLAPRTGVAMEEIVAGLQRGCANMQFNAGVMALARNLRHQGVKTALVTVNADVFTDVVVPAHGLDQMFDVIVNSATERERDKRLLWPRAFGQLQNTCTFENSLLIDDHPRCVQWFQAAGGTSYLYKNDDELAAWLARGKVVLRVTDHSSEVTRRQR